jgi:hypothetical protein
MRREEGRKREWKSRRISRQWQDRGNLGIRKSRVDGPEPSKDSKQRVNEDRLMKVRGPDIDSSGPGPVPFSC